MPGIDGSPDKMLQARIFSHADAHRSRVGTNYPQLPVNRPHTEVHSYSKEGAMRYEDNPPEVPVCAPNSAGGPAAETQRAGRGGWQSDGELVRSAASLHSEDDVRGQAGTLVREVMSAEERDRLVETITGHTGGVTRADVRERAVQYGKNVDAEIGSRVEAALPPVEGSTAPGEQLSEPNPDGDLVGTDVAGKI